MGRHAKKRGRPAGGAAPPLPAAPSGLLAGRGGAWIVLAVTLVLVALAYGNAVHGRFVYDDQKQILRNPLIQEPGLLGKALRSDVWAFSGAEGEAWSNYWRPAFVAWLALHYRWLGPDPVGWHLTNLLLHVLATSLGFFLLRALGARPAVAAAATWAFAVWPVHVESVTWISGSPDPMTASLLFGAALCHLAARRGRRRWGLRAAALAAFGAALLAKEIAIVFPAIVCATEWILAERREGAAKRAALATLPYVGVAAAYLAVRLSLVGFHPVTAPGAPGAAAVVWSAPGLLLFYLRHLLLPFGLGPTYPFHPVTSPGLADFVLPLLADLAAAWGVLLLCRRDRVCRLALPWLVFPLLPVFDVRAFVPEDVAHDRYLYLPLFGALALILTAAAWALDRWAPAEPRRTGERQAGLTVAGLVLAAAMVPATRSYNRAWLDETSLWERGVETNPGTAFPHMELGEAYRLEGRLEEARRELERALELNPGLTAGHVTLAAVARQQGRLAEAESHLRTVLAQYPDLSGALELLGMVYQAEGKLGESMAVYEHARQAIPYQRGLYTVNLAVLHKMAGRDDLARRELESLGPDLGGTQDPKVMRAWWYLADLDRAAGRRPEAIALYEKYLAATAPFTTPDVLALRQATARQLQALRSAAP